MNEYCFRGAKARYQVTAEKSRGFTMPDAASFIEFGMFPRGVVLGACKASNAPKQAYRMPANRERSAAANAS